MNKNTPHKYAQNHTSLTLHDGSDRICDGCSRLKEYEMLYRGSKVVWKGNIVWFKEEIASMDKWFIERESDDIITYDEQKRKGKEQKKRRLCVDGLVINTKNHKWHQ
eukprot:595571_1